MTAVNVDGLPHQRAREVLGGRVLAVDDATGTARVRYVPGVDLQNPNGTILGGYLAAMIDDAAGVATWFGAAKRNFATAQMSVSFLRAAKPGDGIIADVVLSGIGTKQAFVEVRLSREKDNKLVATGTLVQTFMNDGAAA